MSRDSGTRSEHEYIERSQKRGGYRPKKPGKRKKTEKIWSAVTLALSSLLCVVCFPLGLVALWTRRARIGSKLLLTFITGILFFALAAYALTVETQSPLYTRLQNRCVYALTLVEQSVQADIYAGQRIAAEAPRLAREALSSAQKWATDALPRAQDNFRAVFSKEGKVAGKAREAAVETLYALKVLPTPVPTPTPAPTPVPTPTPEPTPRPLTEAQKQAGQSVWRVPGERPVHAKADCTAATGGRELSYFAAQIRGYAKCPLCFAPAVVATLSPQ